MKHAQRPRRIATIVSVFALVCGATLSYSSAQDPGKSGGGTGGSAKGKAQPEFELPPDMTEAADKQASTPEGAVQRLRRDLARYPSAAAKRAISELLTFGPAAIPPLRAMLDAPDVKARVGAAVALAGLLDRPSAPRIAALASDTRHAEHASALFDAVYTLSIDDAEKAALEGANARNGAIRRAALSSLTANTRPETIPGLRALLSSEHEKTRLEAFQMLEKLNAPGLEIEAVRLLGDLSAPLSARVCEWLVVHRNDAIVAELVGLARNDPPNRKDLWAVLAIAQIEERYGAAIFREDQISVFRNRLRSLDPLVRLSSAIALAHVASRSESVEAEELLSAQVVPAIVETYLRGDYFKDALPLLEMCSTRLRRLTGIELGTDLTRWREAWLGGGVTPRIRRDLNPTQIVEAAPNLIVTYERRGVEARGEDRVLTFAAVSQLEVGSTDPSAEGWLYVDNETMSALAQQLADSGVLKGRPSAPQGVSKTLFRSLSVRSDNRERIIAIGPESDAPFEAIEAALFALGDREYWQRLFHGPRAEFKDWYVGQAPLFSKDAKPEDRAQLLFASIAFAIPRLDSAMRCEALGVLLRDDFTVRQLTSADVKVLIGALDGELVVEGPLSLVAAIVAKRGDPESASMLVESFGAKFGVESAPSIGRIVASSGQLSQALRSSSFAVRLGALTAVRGGAAAALAEVAPLVSDPDARVRREAVFALASMSDPAARAQVAQLVGDLTSPLHRVAVEALGLIPDSEAATMLETLASGADLGEATAAMRGIARRPGGVGATLLARFVSSPTAEPERRTAALEALAGIEGPVAVEVLRDLLRNAPESERVAVAYVLANRFETAAAPVLIGVLETDPTASRARDSLEMLFCCDGGERGEFFTQRWNTAAERSGDDWFALAIDPSGLERGGSPSIRALVNALRDERWYVRHGATVRLSSRLGASIVSPGRFATDDQVELVARRLEGLVRTRTYGG